MSGSPDDPFAQHQARQDEPLQLPLVTRRFGVRTAVLDAAAKQPAPVPRSEGPRQLPLERKKLGVRVALLDDKHLLHHARLILAARGPLPAETLQRLPASAKLGPVEQIAQLVSLALPGIGLAPLPEAPPGLPRVADAAYFELDRTGELFHALDASAAIALHLPPDEWLEELELELWACSPDRGTRTVGDRP